MSQKDLDSKESILNMREELDFNEYYDSLVSILDNQNEIVLATSCDNRVTSRTVTYVNNELTVFFFSWSHNKKIKQIRENPNVSLCLKDLQIEGIASILDHPLDEKNANYIDFFYKRLPKRMVDTFTNIPEMILVKIEPEKIVRFVTLNNRFFLQNVSLSEKKVYQMRLEDKKHPYFPY